MSITTPMKDFILDWFEKFDRLDTPESFLGNLHPDVEWNMPDADYSLHGHDRFIAWYRDILEKFERPTTHKISQIVVRRGTVSFHVEFQAKAKSGEIIIAHAKESWRFNIQSDGSPLITKYDVTTSEQGDST